MTMNEKPKERFKFWLDFVPLLVFFLVNWKFGIFNATLSIMITLPISILLSQLINKHIPKMLIISGTLILIFGSLTIYFKDESFIKIKPTIIYTIFSGILCFGLFKGKSYLKYILETTFPKMEEKGWMLITRNWAIFFGFLALLNEYIWRNYSTDQWVSFKVFGYMGITFIFIFSQVPIIMKYLIKNSTENK
ncbi:MAG: septation protein A [Sphingomonadales bacterium]|jgi:intracellular septation protein